MKSIYSQDDLRCTAVGLDLKDQAETWFGSILAQYPDHNPRELVELCSTTFTSMSNRRILHLRNVDVLKKHVHVGGQVCSPSIDCDAVRCQNYRAWLEDNYDPAKDHNAMHSAWLARNEAGYDEPEPSECR